MSAFRWERKAPAHPECIPLEVHALCVTIMNATRSYFQQWLPAWCYYTQRLHWYYCCFKVHPL